MKAFVLVILLVLSQFSKAQSQKSTKPAWPVITQETKPWSRWWWHGNAVTKEGITAEMEAYQKAGLGGLEITPIYGVVGKEDQFINYLSPKWMEMLVHTLREAERLHMGIDMATGTGWPFGGPWVKEEDACKEMHYTLFELKGGSRLSVKVEYIQKSLVRAIGNPVFENPGQIRLDPKSITIGSLKEPIGSNKNLQGLALDQVRFEKPLNLITLRAFGPSKEPIDLTSKVDAAGNLDWIAPEGEWKLFALFEGSHGKMVERAGPGGEGNVIDHFSSLALKNYLSKFDSAFKNQNIQSLRAFFNDSYEVDDAQGTADWTPKLFEDFYSYNGYDLRDHLPALFGKDTEELNTRILCDYRETISRLLLENFTQPWKTWAHKNDARVRNQAHGSPSNILDLYSVVDIPEIEGVEPLRIKMASSAGNVTGKKLVSSESATWLNEHFQSNLADIKVALDRFMLNGVNHIFYHGTCYSPPGEPWPGRLFYAAVHLNPRNPLWDHFGTLNDYVARCQSFLQNTQPDNDVLVYFPVYDRFSFRGREMLEHFDGIGRQFANSPFEKAATSLMENSYAFDYISDKQIGNIAIENGLLKTEGGAKYQTIVIPHCEFIPLKTFQKLISLARSGATVIFFEGYPATISGYSNYENNKMAYEELKKAIGLSADGSAKVDQGKIILGNDLTGMLTQASIRKESLGKGLQFIRKKKQDGNTLYMIVNGGEQPFNGWIPLRAKGMSAMLYNPMNGETGKSLFRINGDGETELNIQLEPKQSIIVELSSQKNDSPEYNYYRETARIMDLTGLWKVKFTEGGPRIPAPVEITALKSWTEWGETDYKAFSGTASYTLNFDRPAFKAKGFLLDLGAVHESAEVWLNNKTIGTLIGSTYRIYIDASLLKDHNSVEIKVSNLMTNRIAQMDKDNIYWKKFYNVNVAARLAENRKNGILDASNWQPKPSGLIGPVRLIAIEK